VITYNPKDWFKLIIQFHKSDTMRILFPTMFILGLFTALTCYITKHYWADYHPTLTIFHQIAGFVISMVLVFRINTAYDRWWEGRKLWGTLVNDSRTLAMKMAVLIPENMEQKRKEAYVLISNFPFILKEHLRGNTDPADLLESASFEQAKMKSWDHQPNYLVMQLSKFCRTLSEEQEKEQNDYRVLTESMFHLNDICGACERIRSTPIPYSYSMFIKKIIFLYIITMPLAFGVSIGYWSIPMVMIIFYAFASLELLSEEIEDPFGTDSNDLPTDEIAVRIRHTTYEILMRHEA
jgi:ion channel-forming bestrophin family protein